VSDQEHARIVETLAGLLDGIAVDEQITPRELLGLQNWLDSHAELLTAPLFDEVKGRVRAALEMKTLGTVAHEALLTYCHEFTGKHAATHPTTSEAFARLQGMALGVLADGRLDDEEIVKLRAWLEDFVAFRQHFVFSTFFDMLDEVSQQRKIDDAQRARVRELCETFGAPPPPRVLPEWFTPAPGLYDFAIPEPPPPPSPWAVLPSAQPAEFVAIDLETANAHPESVCALGLALVTSDASIAAGATYVAPPGDFDPLHVKLHHIHPEQVEDAGDFATHWDRVAPVLETGWVVAHNATFAGRCLHALMRVHGLKLGAPVKLLCTLRLARATWPDAPGHALATLAVHLDLPRPGHDPEDGSRACAELMLRLLALHECDSPAALASKLGVQAIEL
jgi:DNA polymerase-3 subunit epsilon